MAEPYRSGLVALVGRPSVGKSTLLNAILGQKISIVASRRQTTRNRILGIKTLDDAQILFVDTPGIHEPKHKLGEYMVKKAKDALLETDAVVFVTDPGKDGERDKAILESLKDLKKPVLLIMNKADSVDRDRLSGVMKKYHDLFPFKEMLAVSAKRRQGIDDFLSMVTRYLPQGPKYYGDDMVTDQVERFMAAEIIREKIMKHTSEEVPHSVAVEVTSWKGKKEGVVVIHANIYLEREGQKGIIIGQKGRMLKLVGTQARADIEKLLGTKVYLELWVKIRKGWRNDTRMLQELGYR
jgi:GTP-binding protein Era